MNMKSLILHRTSREQIQKGITVIAKAEGTHLYDQEGEAISTWFPG